MPLRLPLLTPRQAPFSARTRPANGLPRFLGVWLIINGVAYLVLSFTGLFFPDCQDKVFLFSQPALFRELVMMLWLVIQGPTPSQPAT